MRTVANEAGSYQMYGSWLVLVLTTDTARNRSPAHSLPSASTHFPPVQVPSYCTYNPRVGSTSNTPYWATNGPSCMHAGMTRIGFTLGWV